MPVGSASARTGSGRRTRTLTALQVMSVLTLLSLAFQFATAGQLLTHRAVSVDVHGGGAIVLHVISGLTVVAAGLHWLKRAHDPVADRDRGTGVLLSFVQAAVGDERMMWAHVPGAMVLTVGALWVAAWSFGRTARR